MRIVSLISTGSRIRSDCPICLDFYGKVYVRWSTREWTRSNKWKVMAVPVFCFATSVASLVALAPLVSTLLRTRRRDKKRKEWIVEKV